MPLNSVTKTDTVPDLRSSQLMRNRPLMPWAVGEEGVARDRLQEVGPRFRHREASCGKWTSAKP